MAQALPFIMAGVGALSSLQQSSQAKKTAEYNAAVAQSNAAQAQAFADADAARARDEAARKQGAMRAKAAASGVDTGTGSVLDVLSDEALQNELDALNIEAKGAAEARSFNMQAEGFRKQARNIKRAAPLSALGAGLSGFASGSKIARSFGEK